MPNFPVAPPTASDYASEFNLLFYTLVGLAVFFTLLVFGLLLFLGVRYRRGSRYSRKGGPDHNIPLEILWSGIPLVMALGIFFWAVGPFARIYGGAPANALEIFVVGKQWMWHMQHANGVRENNELHIPVGRPVKLTLISQDVIHSFFVPAFRIHRDVLPGRYTSVWFTPTAVGQYHLFCSQYCGTQHSKMTGTVFVMEPKDYEAWMASGGTKTAAAHVSMEQSGSQLFTDLACVQCHGLAPARAPSLVGLYGQKVRLADGSSVTADDAYLRESIVEPDAKVVEGYQAIMPSFKGTLSEEQVLDLIAFIKSMSGPGITAGSGATGVPAGGAGVGSTAAGGGAAPAGPGGATPGPRAAAGAPGQQRGRR